MGGEVGNISEKNMDRCSGKREPGNRGRGLTREERKLPVWSLRSCADDTVCEALGEGTIRSISKVTLFGESSGSEGR